MSLNPSDDTVRCIPPRVLYLSVSMDPEREERRVVLCVSAARRPFMIDNRRGSYIYDARKVFGLLVTPPPRAPVTITLTQLNRLVVSLDFWVPPPLPVWTSFKYRPRSWRRLRRRGRWIDTTAAPAAIVVSSDSE